VRRVIRPVVAGAGLGREISFDPGDRDALPCWNAEGPMPDQICFVIAPIGEEGSEIRKRSDRVFNYLIEPAALACGYKAVRADKISKPGIITMQVIEQVLNAPMTVADLTGHNANAFYELAIRHMVKKPLVQMITKGERIPFDLAASRVLYYDEPSLETVEKTRADLAEHIRSAEGGVADADNPISVSVERHALRTSGDPLGTQVAELGDALSTFMTVMQTEISALRTEMEMNALDRLSRSGGTLRALIEGPSASGAAGGFRVGEGLGLADIARPAYNVRSQDRAKGTPKGEEERH